MKSLLLVALLSLSITALASAQPLRAPSEREAVAAVVKGNTDFAVDLHHQLRQQPGNLCYSPWSISTVLAMTSAGAQGQTQEQMTKTLHLPDPSLTHLGNAGILKHMTQQRGYELNAANAMFVAKDVPWRKEFLDQTHKYYGSSIFTVDFQARPELARQSINSWVEGQTRKRIANLIPERGIDSTHKIVLVNAVYFKGDWDKPFKKKQTEPMFFSLTVNDKVKTPTMFQAGAFLYGENKDVQVLGMPYKGNDLMMVFVLPCERNALSALEKDLTGKHFQDWIARLENHPSMDVYLPRFKMTSEFNLTQVLASMGMRDAFTDAADFGGMTKGYPLKVSAVRHKTFVDLQEEGTEAAAATSVKMLPLSAAPPVRNLPPRPVFRADHPFLFSIVDRRSGSLVFVGRVSDPTR